MDYNVSFVGGNDVIVGGEVECFVQEVLADGWIELFNVKTDEAEVLFVFDRFEPYDNYIHKQDRKLPELLNVQQM